MNIVIAHGYAHRLLRNNIIESTPYAGQDEGFLVWKQRSAEEMDLSGGDVELIRRTLELFGHIFPSNEQRLPGKVRESKQTANPMEPKG